MPIDVNRPSDDTAVKPRLSRLGIFSLALVVVIAAVTAGTIYSMQQNKKQAEQRAAAINAAVDHAVSVCKNAVAATGGDSGGLAGRLSRLNGEKNVLTKADQAIDMIGFCLSGASGRQDVIDELNGARNRIQVALRDYKAG